MMARPRTTSGRSCIVGHLVLPGPLVSSTAKVSISLIDATMADKPASVIAKTEFQVEKNTENRIGFVLEAPPRPLKSRWLFDATVTADEKGHLAPGDFVLTRSVAYDDLEPSTRIVLVLQRVT